MTWCLYFLTKHPEVQEKVYQEIEEVLGDEDIKPMVSSELKSVTQVYFEVPLLIHVSVETCYTYGHFDLPWRNDHTFSRFSHKETFEFGWRLTLWKFIPMGLKHECNKYIDRTDKFFNIIICQNKTTKGLKSRVVQRWFDYKRQNLAVTGQN